MRYLIVVAFFAIISCNENPIPKPKAYLKLSYAKASYHKLKTDCSYSFELSNQANFTQQPNCWAKLYYPSLKATVHFTYRQSDKNLPEALKEIEKLTLEHAVKADAINVMPYENQKKRVYGKVFNVDGNAASNLQFLVTDNVDQVVSGALYFYTKPNFDSIAPAIQYIEKDIIHLIETFEWKK